MRALAALALVALTSCSPSRSGPVVVATGSAPITAVWPCARGVSLRVPDWFAVAENKPALDAEPQGLTVRQECVAEIDSAAFPDGWQITVAPPAFYVPAYRILATGETGQGWTVLGESPTRGASLPILPAASYEAANARTGTESGGAAALASILSVQQGGAP